ncbi:hypothetical protein [Allorhizocola rhizosphaerae]|uniref:hypothetical protein n=1 Tax=Allorhizocola rhizosphaerae TaxID=1872709 RepID=UPI000E3D86DC|nr:hypothetical protein [Allorhizocola rhizosphaerae]
MTKQWEHLLVLQSGVVTYQQAVTHTSRSHVAHQVAKERWRRASQGVFVTTGGQLTTRQKHWVAVLGIGEGAVLAGLAAAREGGLRLETQEVVDLLVPGGVRRKPKLLLRDMPQIRVHRTAKSPKRIGAPARTTMARSVVDAAQWARSDKEAQLIVAAACQQRRATPGEILRAIAEQPRAKRRHLVRETANYAEGGATSIPEIEFAVLCRRHGLPEPDRQVWRRDASGRMRYLDAYWHDHQLHLEIDGAHHMDAEHWGADMLRQNEIWLKGDRVLRFPAFLLRTDPESIVAQLRRAMDT